MAGAVSTAGAAALPLLETWTLDAGSIRAWVATASPGQKLTYARHFVLPRQSPGAALARKLEQDRHVTLVQQPLGGGLKNYVMQRLKPQRASIGRVQPAKRPALDGDMARVMNVLRRLTREAMPCPCNSDLGKLAGVGNASQASYVLRKLSEAGFIRSVIVNAATGARVITIIASGAQTREPRP